MLNPENVVSCAVSDLKVEKQTDVFGLFLVINCNKSSGQSLMCSDPILYLPKKCFSLY